MIKRHKNGFFFLDSLFSTQVLCRSVCTELFKVNLFDNQIGGWLVSKKNKNKNKKKEQRKKEKRKKILGQLYLP